MTDKKIDGQPLNYIGMNLLMYGEADPDCPTMHPKTREAIDAAMRKYIKPSSLKIGAVLITSTVSEETNGDYRELWQPLKTDK